MKEIRIENSHLKNNQNINVPVGKYLPEIKTFRDKRGTLQKEIVTTGDLVAHYKSFTEAAIQNERISKKTNKASPSILTDSAKLIQKEIYIKIAGVLKKFTKTSHKTQVICPDGKKYVFKRLSKKEKIQYGYEKAENKAK